MKYLMVTFFFVLCFFEVNYTQSFSTIHHYFSNSFPGGQINMNGVVTDVPYVEGNNQYENSIDDGISHDEASIVYTAVAIDGQNNNNYEQLFYQWNLSGEWRTNNHSMGYMYLTGAIGDLYSVLHQAMFHKKCIFSFESEMDGIITVNGQNYSSPTQNFNVEETYSITASVPQEIIEDNLKKCFVRWIPGNTTNPSLTVTASEHQNYYAEYEFYPSVDFYTRNLHFNTYNPRFPETNLILYWNQYPNSQVGYQVWRKVYDLNWSLQSGPTLLTTITNNATISYTDNSYWIRNNVNQTVNILYDVRPIYIPDGTTWESESWVNTWGESSAQSKSSIANESKIITEYSLSNYPNPFNPVTMIEYQIPNAGDVTIKVYNALGSEVATLVNDRMDVGKYTVEFDGTNLTSGIYFCVFKSGNYISTNKMLLVK